MSNKLKLNDSGFAMWRGIVALAHIDHKLTDDEVDFFKKQLERVELSPAQEQILDNDLANGIKLVDVYNDITEPAHRTNLLNMGYVIFHRDGDFCHVEKAFYDELHSKHIKDINPKKLSEDIKKDAQEELEKWARERDYKEDLPGLSDDIQDFFSWLF
jgi:hypothetical protein